MGLEVCEIANGGYLRNFPGHLNTSSSFDGRDGLENEGSIPESSADWVPGPR